MTTISATSILSSRHAITGDRLDTLLLRMPRVILAEFNTHRVFSRNAASSRAIPVAKLIEDVRRDPFVPLVWSKNERGMQGRELLGDDEQSFAVIGWAQAAKDAVYWAEKLSTVACCHKQIVNRILEPYAHVTVVVSSTTWDGFLTQRDHADAEPHMQMLAREIRKALDGAKPLELQPGAWHLPFISEQEWIDTKSIPYGECVEMFKKLSVARCASTSYKTVDGFDMSLERATEIYDKLRAANPIHASPFEHVAQADSLSSKTFMDEREFDHPEQHRNFRGFRQLRAMIEGE